MSKYMKSGTPVGTLKVTKPLTIRQSFETAAWYKVHQVLPGEYTVYYKASGGSAGLLVNFQSEVTDAYMGTLYGGVAVGSYSKDRDLGPDNISQADGFYICDDLIPFAEFGEFTPQPDQKLPRVGPWNDRAKDYTFNILTN